MTSLFNNLPHEYIRLLASSAGFFFLNVIDMLHPMSFFSTISLVYGLGQPFSKQKLLFKTSQVSYIATI